ncbi:MAG: ATP-binding cassette domain-containing protein [Spiroplasma phoeniceum]|nr:MAG: ATP-binding cassette domain-containing protein [Spiroplasma phoeniceum]
MVKTSISIIKILFHCQQKIGIVFEKPNPFPKSVYENIAFGLKSLGIFNKRILDQTGELSSRQAALWDEVKDNLQDSALSLLGAKQQRLCIARAIALKTEILLMNELTSALDPIATAKFEELILDLKKNFIIIIVTHSLQQAVRIFDYTAFFEWDS